MKTALLPLLTLSLLAALPGRALAAAGDPPAGGAALDQVIIATAAAAVLTAGLLVVGLGHRSGRVPLLARLSGFAERVSGMPGWAALPAGVATGALLVAFLGFMWDVAIHIDQGRDEGPLANPAHFFILAGLFGIFAAGFLACVMPLTRPSRSAVRVVGEWYAPLGGVLLVACGSFALIGFPLDDVWHRIFGQDVTLWGPTHLMLIGGAAMTLLGIAVLLVEGERANPRAAATGKPWVHASRRIGLSGGLLIGLCVFQAEFDFGVPQFRLVFGPILVMLAAGVGLVATRAWLGRGAALGAVGFYLVVRGAVSAIVGPGFGETAPHFPLFVAEALVVELVFLALPRARALTLGAACGAAIGTVGLAAEWAWTHVWMPIPWTSELLPEGAAFGFAAAMAGSLVGAWIGERLAADRVKPTRGARAGAVAGALAIFAIVGIALPKPAVEGVSVDVSLAHAGEAGARQVTPTVRFEPPGATTGAEMLNVTAWQGGGLLVEELRPAGGPGVYTTDEPVPVHGEWKALIRMSRGDTLSAAPIYLPEDSAIPAPEVAAERRFTRELVADHRILQREQQDAPAFLTAAAYLAVAAIALALLVLLAWGLHRLARASGPYVPREDPNAGRTPRPARSGRRGIRARLST